ncbi:hypothetical protein D9611_002903 [Ephemerocybe angulata]|uniref:F-box domain-containing protein n=1 Tax=Ephemerocybe angulata TaxID=980116 RepID=A0A8H5FHT5_9AGAR|nr:hypothetical protein D9611_002903 [Tulosesus angulatus]
MEHINGIPLGFLFSEIGLPKHLSDMASTSTGKGPSDKEREDIYKLLEEYESELPVLQAKILLCRTLLSPVRQLPFDIMAQIFEEYMATTASRNPWTVLCQVCGSWRDIALAHAPLWLDLCVSAKPDGTVEGSMEPPEGRAAAAHAWVKRVRTCAWSLKVLGRKAHNSNAPNVDAPGNGTLLHSLLTPDAIDNLQYLHLAGSLDISGLGTVTYPGVASVVSNTTGSNLLQQGYPSLPALKKAVLPNLHGVIHRTHFPWPQLTHLYLGTQLTFEESIPIFRQSINLQRACIHYQSGDTMAIRSVDFMQTDTIPLPNLTDLTFLGNAPLGNFINYGFTWPNLENLRLWQYPTFFWSDASKRLIRSTTRLHITTLELGGSFTLFTQCIEACPNLTYLVLEPNSTTYGELFHFFTYGAGGLNLPRLQFLSVYCNLSVGYELNMDWVLEEGLAEMLASRSPGHAPYLGCAVLKRFLLRVSLGEFSDPIAIRAARVLEQFKDVMDVTLIRGNAPSVHQVPPGGLDHWDRGLGEFLDGLWTYGKD